MYMLVASTKFTLNLESNLTETNLKKIGCHSIHETNFYSLWLESEESDESSKWPDLTCKLAASPLRRYGGKAAFQEDE